MVDPRLFQALSDATRLEILSVLTAGPINVSRIVAHVGCAQPAVSRHLRVLREASLIHDKRKGKEVEYSINQSVLLAVVDHLTGLAGSLAGEAERGKAEGEKSVRGKVGGKSQRRKAELGRRESGTAASKQRKSEQAAPADFAPREADYTVERRPSDMDDFLL